MIDKKCHKKLNRCIGILKRHDPHVALSTRPTTTLFIGNGGILCGHSEDSLRTLLSPYGTVTAVKMMQHRPYAFATMDSADAAQAAVAAVHGTRGTHGRADGTPASGDDRVPVYLTFVEPWSLEAKVISSTKPEGLVYLEDFITADEEARLISFVDTLEMGTDFQPTPNSEINNVTGSNDNILSSEIESHDKPAHSSLNNSNNPGAAGRLKHRRVYHFGYKFVYGSNSVDLTNPAASIPPLIETIMDTIAATQLTLHRPDQLTINVYEPGQGIPSHTDTHSAFQDAIISLSLASDVNFDLQLPPPPTATDGRGDDEMSMDDLSPATSTVDTANSEEMPADNVSLSNVAKYSLNIKQRSLLVMLGESRYVWKHGIAPRLYDTLDDGVVRPRGKRISLTFRAVRRQPCACPFPSYCDVPSRRANSEALSANFISPISNQITNLPTAEPPKPTLPSTSAEAASLESTFVSDVYENIADHFDVTRHSLWPGVTRFLDALPDGATVLDVGCGNGKYLDTRSEASHQGENEHKGADAGSEQKGAPHNPRLIKIGCDRAMNLCRISAAKGCDVFASDTLALPVSPGRFDAVISIAVIHHMATPQRRRQAIAQLLSCVTRSTGRVLIYVWAFEQQRGKQKSAYLKSGPAESEPESPTTSTTAAQTDVQTNVQLEVHKNRTNFTAQDVLVPWTKQRNLKSSKINQGNVVHNNNKSMAEPQGTNERIDVCKTNFLRYYHVFKEGELEALCIDTRMCTVEQSWYEQGNWCVVLRRT